MEDEDASVFLLLKFRNGEPFSDIHPLAIHRHVKVLVGSLKTAKPIKSGALLVHTHRSSQTATLLGIEELFDQPVTVELADRLNTVEAAAYAPSLKQVTDEELLTELEPQGVIGVRRLRPRSDGSPNHLIRFRFRGLRYPESITFGFEIFNLRLWIQPPPLCRRCAKFGHTDKSCTASTICCLKCSGQHITEDCREDQRCCPHCGGPHAAWQQGCPALRDQLGRAEEQQQAAAGPPLKPKRLTYAEAITAPNEAPARQQQKKKTRSGDKTCQTSTATKDASVQTDSAPVAREAEVQTDSAPATREAEVQTEPPSPTTRPLTSVTIQTDAEGRETTSTQTDTSPEQDADYLSPLQTRGQRQAGQHQAWTARSSSNHRRQLEDSTDRQQHSFAHFYNTGANRSYWN